jgi:hypothetical protein
MNQREQRPTAPNEQHLAETDVIEDFWRWFVGVEAALAHESPPPALLDELTVRLQEDLGVPGWEIAPVGDGSMRRLLALSPEGEPELLALTGAVVDAAPELPGWMFYAARPPRPGAPLHFTMGDVDVDARTWRFVCLQAPDPDDDETGIVVEQPGLDRVFEREGDRLAAAVICIDGLIGEGRRLQTFSEVFAVSRLRAHEERVARPIAELPAALDESVDETGDDDDETPTNQSS